MQVKLIEKSLIQSNDEWSPLKSIIVGSAIQANWPTKGEFRNLEKTTQWHSTPVPSGPVSKQIIEKTNLDLDRLANLLTGRGVEVTRPDYMDFQALDGMYNYCPRDRLLILDDRVVDCNMTYDVRLQEIQALDMVTNDADVIQVPRQQELKFDAANVARFGKNMLYLISESGTPQGFEWCKKTFTEYNWYATDSYGGVHIDSTFVPVREGLIVLNKDRLKNKPLPDFLNSWDKIWIGKEDISDKPFVDYPYASNYIQLNFLMIDPSTAVTDINTGKLKQQLEDHDIEVLESPLYHSRTLGGGHHCVTLDTLRIV